MSLILSPLIGIPLIHPETDLGGVLLKSLSENEITLVDGDILVVTQKIVSKSEGRLVDLKSITPSLQADELAVSSEKDPRLVELILRESREILRIRPGTIIVEHNLGFICASAGIDHSNVFPEDPKSDPNDYVLLLPKNPDRSALEIRRNIEKKTHTHIGVMIIDSQGRAWRNGVTGMCIGLSGFPPIVDKRGDPDLFGYQLKITLIAVADELAAAASLVMGQADEGTPVVHVRGFPYSLGDGSLKDLLRPKDQDLFR